MAWEGELVSTEAEAKAFLQRALAQSFFTLLPKVSFEENADGLKVSIVSSKKAVAQKDKESYLKLSLTDEDRLVVKDLYVDEPFRGTDLSLMLMKVTCAVAAEREASCLEINAIVGAGFSFWPRVMDAVPSQISPDFADALYLASWRRDLSAAEKQVFRAASEAGETDAYAGWRQLAQATLSGTGFSLRQKLMKKEIGDRNLFSFLGAPPTRAVIESRIGAIPPFRHPSTLNLRPGSVPAAFL